MPLTDVVRRLCAVPCALALAAAPGHAAEAVGAPAATPATATAPPMPEPAPEPAAAPSRDPVEELRRSVRLTALWLARGVDSWFGDRPFEDGGSVRDGVLSVGLLHRPPDGLDASVRFNARFRLPNVEERAYLFVGRDNTREVETDQPGSFTRQQRLQAENADDTRFFAGIGLLLRESTDLRVGFRGGIKPYVQLRYRQPFEIGRDRFGEFRQTLFWTVDDHLGTTTAMSVERPVGRDLAVRWLTSLTYTQDSARWEGQTSLGAYRRFGPSRLLSLELLASAAQHTGVGLTDYGLRAKWQQPLHREGLIGEALVGYFWPRADDSVPRDPGWALGGTLTLRF